MYIENAVYKYHYHYHLVSILLKETFEDRRRNFKGVTISTKALQWCFPVSIFVLCKVVLGSEC